MIEEFGFLKAFFHIITTFHTEFFCYLITYRMGYSRTVSAKTSSSIFSLFVLQFCLHHTKTCDCCKRDEFTKMQTFDFDFFSSHGIKRQAYEEFVRNKLFCPSQIFSYEHFFVGIFASKDFFRKRRMNGPYVYVNWAYGRVRACMYARMYVCVHVCKMKREHNLQSYSP